MAKRGIPYTAISYGLVEGIIYFTKGMHVATERGGGNSGIKTNATSLNLGTRLATLFW
jgi:hypothetical protein